MSDSLIGFELLLHSVKRDIKKKEDILLLLVHHCLVKAGFKCAGTGEDWENDDQNSSEILPNEWNVSKEYVLRYKREDIKYILMSNRSDDVIVFNLTSPKKMKVTNVIFNVDKSVETIDGNIFNMVPTHENVIQEIKQKLVTPFDTIQKVDMNTQTTENPPSEIKILPMTSVHSPRFSDYDLPDITSVGRRDLDPLAAMGGGGGMLFDPLRESRNRIHGNIGIPQRLPRGAIPPRARFDPFGPPDTGIPGRPPPDYDDMFG